MPTIRTVTVKQSGGDYTSLSAAEAGEQGDLVSLDRQLDIVCYPLTDNTAVTIDGWTTDSTRYIRIVTDQTARHAGIWDGTKYRIFSTSNLVSVIGIVEDYVRLEYLQAETVASNPGPAIKTTSTGGATSDIRITGCIARAPSSSGDAAVNLSGGTITMQNCIVVGGVYCVYLISSASTAAVNADNCTVISAGAHGFLRNSGTMTLRNCYSGNNVTDAYSGTITRTTCAHDTATSFSGSTGGVSYNTSNFNATSPDSIFNNCISYWNFEETSGQRFDRIGRFFADPFNNITSDSGKIGTAAKSDGSSTTRLALNSALDDTITNKFFCGGWAYFDAVNTGTPQDCIRTDESGLGGNGFYVRESGGKIQVGFHNGTAYQEKLGATTVSAGTWYYVGINYNAGALDVVLNGASDGQLSTSGNLNQSTTAQHFFSYNNGERMAGRLDEWGLWKDDMTSNWSTLYGSGAGYNPVLYHINLRPTSSSALKGVGTDLSGTFTTDIAGNLRTAWDIGAFAAPGGITNLGDEGGILFQPSYVW